MARIAGVDLPRDKRIVVALTYIYGIGDTTAKKICADAGVSEDVAKEALRLAANKLSVKCKFVKKETEIGGDVDEDK